MYLFPLTGQIFNGKTHSPTVVHHFIEIPFNFMICLQKECTEGKYTSEIIIFTMSENLFPQNVFKVLRNYPKWILLDTTRFYTHQGQNTILLCATSITIILFVRTMWFKIDEIDKSTKHIVWMDRSETFHNETVLTII